MTGHTLDLEPYAEQEAQIQVFIPCASASSPPSAAPQTAPQIARLQAAAGSVPTIDVEGYVAGELVGGIELRFAPEQQQRIYLPIVTRQ